MQGRNYTKFSLIMVLTIVLINVLFSGLGLLLFIEAGNSLIGALEISLEAILYGLGMACVCWS